ncbi:MAG: TetR/AcrR family transcriptional regulator [Actinomycetota bacterium]|nr:TetR/AcrR family transcriptional regulator [Actinomycetota bacterium]
MSPVKRRQRIAAEETQRVIVLAAAELFFEHGYHATSISRIAAAAGVAVQTIYNSIGSKSDLLSRVLDYAAAGERAPVSVPTFMREQAESESDPAQIIDQLVTFWQGALKRTAPVFQVIREAAAIDPEAAALENKRAAQRLRNYQIAARILKDRGALRDDLTLDQAAAAIFAIGHPEAYRTLVLEGSWNERQWANWARTTLETALLAP